MLVVFFPKYPFIPDTPSLVSSTVLPRSYSRYFQKHRIPAPGTADSLQALVAQLLSETLLYIFLVVTYYVSDKTRPCKSHWVSQSGHHKAFSPHDPPTWLSPESRQHVTSHWKYLYKWLSVGDTTGRDYSEPLNKATFTIINALLWIYHIISNRAVAITSGNYVKFTSIWHKLLSSIRVEWHSGSYLTTTTNSIPR